MVPGAGIEPARPEGRQILSFLRPFFNKSEQLLLSFIFHILRPT